MGMGNGTGVQDREWDCNWDVRRRMGQGAWGAEWGMELGWGYKPQDGDWDRDRDRDRESGTGGMGWVGMWDGELDWDWDVRCEMKGMGQEQGHWGSLSNSPYLLDTDASVHPLSIQVQYVWVGVWCLEIRPMVYLCKFPLRLA